MINEEKEAIEATNKHEIDQKLDVLEKQEEQKEISPMQVPSKRFL